MSNRSGSYIGFDRHAYGLIGRPPAWHSGGHGRLGDGGGQVDEAISCFEAGASFRHEVSVAWSQEKEEDTTR